MLSIKPIAQSNSAQHYYTSQDNYYLKDKDSLKDLSSWEGKGAEALKLQGIVEPSEFLKLLNGELPNGEVIGVTKEGKRNHRAGTDITLSAPKSISILALVGKDERVLEAHKKAVEVTFKRIEKIAAEARITHNNKTTFEKTNNLTAATFLHTSSRELDPALHTHMVIMNMTERSDGKWRALASRSKNDKENLDNGFREIIYNNQHYLGLVYTSTLAKEVKSLGFDIRIKDEFGNFEIKGISDETINALSKRREQIVRNMEHNGYSSAKAAEKSNLATRSKKAEIDNDTLIQIWQDEIKALGVNLDKLIAESITRDSEGSIVKNNIEPLCQDTKSAVLDALSHLSEFNTQIKHSTLVRQAMLFSGNNIEHEKIENEILSLFKKNEIVGKTYDYYTTENLLAKEKSFVEALKQKPISRLDINNNETGLAASILKNNHRIQIIDVNGLSNEKTLLQDFINVSEKNKLNAYILHQGKSRAQHLAGQLKHESSGIFSFLKNFTKDELVHTVAGFKYQHGQTLKASIFTKNKDDVVIIHDAQKLSYNDLLSINEITKKSNIKLVLLNNTASLVGFSPGNPIKVLKENGISYCRSNTQFRNIDVTLSSSNQFLKDMSLAWAEKDKSEREGISIITMSKKQEIEITETIRKTLKDSGDLSIQSKNISVFSSERLSEVEKKREPSYQVGDRLTFKPFTKNQAHYDVMGIEQGALILKNKNGVESKFDLNNSEDFILSRPKQLEVAIGDKIKNDRVFYFNKTKFEKHQDFTITNIGPDYVELKTEGRTIKLNDDFFKDKYFSYNYCKRPHALTSQDKKSMVAAESFKLNKNFIGEIGEFSKEITIFTNDLSKAQKFLDQEQMKYSATDIKNNKPSLIYRNINHIENAFEKDLNLLLDNLDSPAIGNKKELAEKAINYALLKCSEANAAFKHGDLLMHALKAGVGEIDFEDIAPVIIDKMKSLNLVYLDSYWTTKNSLILEDKILKNNTEEQGKLSPIEGNKKNLLSLPETLTKGQKDAVTLLTTSSDRFVSVQGLAGVGKTTMMRHVQEIANKNSFKVKGLAPTHKAVSELAKNSISSDTVDSFLLNDAEINEKTLLIVDESSMLSNEKYYRLQQKAIEANARIAFVGDITQLQSLSSGIPHELTIKSKTQKIAYMNEIVRQNPNPELKKVAELASNRQIEGAFETLKQIDPEKYIERQKPYNHITNSSLVEINCMKDGQKDCSPIYKAIADDFLSRTKECQENTIVVSPAHADRAEIDSLIREGLKSQGEISKDEIKCHRLIAKNLDKADQGFAKSYKAGEVICFGKSYYIGKKGEYFSIHDIDEEKNRVHCTNEEGQSFSIKASILPKAQIAVYKPYKNALAIGDRIRIKKSDKEKGYIANEEFKVAQISNKAIVLKNNDKEITLNSADKSSQHWDYAYTNTAYSSQGATSKLVIALELSNRNVTTNHRSHEIIATRASHQATIYTDDSNALINRLSNLKNQLNHDKTSATFKQLEFENKKVIRKNILTNSSPKQSLNSSKPLISSNKISNVGTVEQRLDAKEILQSLNAQSERLIKNLLGEPNHKLSTKREYRYGSKGSLKVNLEKGLWHNFESGESGNLYTLIESELGFSSFKETLEYAANFTSHMPAYKPVLKAKSSEEKNNIPNKMQELAKKLYDSSKSIEGTLVEKYLLFHRGITQYKHADIRFCPRVYTKKNGEVTYSPAMLSFSKNESGDINHVQVTRLDKRTANKDKSCDLVKQTYGSISNHAVNLNQKGEGDTTYLTEGVETGLSLLEIDNKRRVLAVLGKENFYKINEKLLTQKVILCIDSDGKNTFKLNKDNTNTILKASERLEKLGFDVSIIIPRETGKDLNDILKSKGKIALSNELSNPISPKDFKERCESSITLNANNEKFQGLSTPTKTISNINNIEREREL